MSSSHSDRFVLTHPQPKHFKALQELCQRVYPFTEPWSEAQLEAHYSYFPDGQLIIIDNEADKIVGAAFSLIIRWDDYSPQDNWRDFTAGGYFHNHDPKKGSTLYGAEVMVDPGYRGQGLGKLLYKGREEIAKRYQLKRIRAGARLRNYSKYKKQFSPEGYTREVVEGRLKDPTLTFQLRQGFVALDVAKNYLFNDPESLGYAAVIEWLNPNVATEQDYKKQARSIKAFMQGLKYDIQYLPRDLRRLVRKVSYLLGEVIREYEGERFFKEIEYYRQALKKTRIRDREVILDKLQSKLKRKKPQESYKIAHSFALLLELINVCEAVYRTSRLQRKPTYYRLSSKVDLDFVLTAHPTEARSAEVVDFLRQLTALLVDGLRSDFNFQNDRIKSVLRMLWHFPLAKSQPPTVLNEAEYIYSLIFSEYLLDFVLAQHGSYTLKLSTWVGGDKDGHPGVDEKVMLSCLEGSRRYIIDILEERLTIVLNDLVKLKKLGQKRHQEINRLNALIKPLVSLRVIKVRDGEKVSRWIHSYQAMLKGSRRLIQQHHQILIINNLLRLFPAFVLPIELREDARLIESAQKKSSMAIKKMLRTLHRITEGYDIRSYVHALIISNCQTEMQISEANRLILECAKSKKLPVVPLFEDKEALLNGADVVKKWLSVKANLNQVKKYWRNRFEVMVGYSDSSKQVGVLASRYLIRAAMYELEKVLQHHGVTPIFFHGAGGSVDRGGGSLGEQVAWWPNSAIKYPTMTIQGEMVQRSFATKEILNSQCLLLSNESIVRKARRVRFKRNHVEDKFVSYVENEYKKLVSDCDFLATLLGATPFHYLDMLKIGSRPARRVDKVDSSALRAIPWVLCWTQTRILLPTWWGVGTAWKHLSREERGEMINVYNRDAFFSSYVRALGYTLTKVELPVWRKYLQANLSRKEADKVFDKFRLEYELAKELVFELTDSRFLIEHKPWLRESIGLRSPYVSLLNLLQIQAMQTKDERLMKETLVGIACGMLSTG